MSKSYEVDGNVDENYLNKVDTIGEEDDEVSKETKTKVRIKRSPAFILDKSIDLKITRMANDLGKFILDAHPDNKAIVAFAHQLSGIRLTTGNSKIFRVDIVAVIKNHDLACELGKIILNHLNSLEEKNPAFLALAHQLIGESSSKEKTGLPPFELYDDIVLKINRNPSYLGKLILEQEVEDKSLIALGHQLSGIKFHPSTGAFEIECRITMKDIDFVSNFSDLLFQSQENVEEPNKAYLTLAEMLKDLT